MAPGSFQIGGLHLWIEDNADVFTTVSALRVFLAVAAHPELSSVELAAICNVSTPTISRIVGNMSRSDNISAALELDYRKEDRRLNSVALSPYGVRLRSQLLQIIGNGPLMR
jgi:DNA-binding MarR family transcriptional regulator